MFKVVEIKGKLTKNASVFSVGPNKKQVTVRK